MYDIEARVTKSSSTELKFTGDWPLDWLQAPDKSTEVIAELLPGQTEPPPSVPIQRLEIPGNRASRPNLQPEPSSLMKSFVAQGLTGKRYGHLRQDQIAAGTYPSFVVRTNETGPESNLIAERNRTILD